MEKMMCSYADAIRFLEVFDHIRNFSVVLHIEKQKDKQHTQLTYQEYKSKKSRTCSTIPICSLWFYLGNFAHFNTKNHLNHLYRNYVDADLLVVENSDKETLDYFFRDCYREKVRKSCVFIACVLNRTSPDLPVDLVDKIVKMSMTSTVQETVAKAEMISFCE